MLLLGSRNAGHAAKNRRSLFSDVIYKSVGWSALISNVSYKSVIR